MFKRGLWVRSAALLIFGMSRVGRANFSLPGGTPNLHDTTWREGLNREQWDHVYHPLRVENPAQNYSYRNAQTEAKEKLSKTWHIMSHVYSSSAGQPVNSRGIHMPLADGPLRAVNAGATIFRAPHGLSAKKSRRKPGERPTTSQQSFGNQSPAGNDQSAMMSRTWSGGGSGSGGFFPHPSGRSSDRQGGVDHRAFLDSYGDPNVRILPGKRASFFQTGEVSPTANRAAAGPLTGLVRRNRHCPPRYLTSVQDFAASRVRRVNQPNVPSFQRVVGL